MLTDPPQQVRLEKNLFRDRTTEPCDCGTEMKVVPGIPITRNECRECSILFTRLRQTLSCPDRMMETSGEQAWLMNKGLSDVDVAALVHRIWKTNASAKLGPIDTRERQSMEYRRKLREKWGNEKGVREIERYVTNFHRGSREQSSSLLHSSADNVVSLQTSRMQPLSRRPCWMRERPRTRTEDGILGKVWSSQRPRGRVSVICFRAKVQSYLTSISTP